jgi:uncharacterized membrane protein YphA (DoxX/SURF4 family)
VPQQDTSFSALASRHDVTREIGDLEDWTIGRILEMGATRAQVAEAAARLRGEPHPRSGSHLVDRIVALARDDLREREVTEEWPPSQPDTEESVSTMLPSEERTEIRERVVERLSTAPWAAPALRVGLGLGFVAQGLSTLGQGVASGQLAELLGQLQASPGALWPWLWAMAQAVGGLALLVGVLVRPIALAGIVVYLVAAPMTGPMGGLPVTALYVGAFLALLATGPGPLSLARWRSPA